MYVIILKFLTNAPSKQVAKLKPLPIINKDFFLYKSSANFFTSSSSFNTLRICSCKFFKPLII